MLWRELPATRGRGASKEQQALACLGTQAERPRFQDGILQGMLGHSRNPVQRHQHAIFRAATLAEYRIAGTLKVPCVKHLICYLKGAPISV
jgi:hypothetical protein